MSPSIGVLWLISGLLFLAAAGSLFLWPRWWWAIGACAIIVSVLIIVPSWTDAKFGALANLVALVGVVFGFLAQGPASLRAEYDRDIDRALARVASSESVTDADLAHLPAPGAAVSPRDWRRRASAHPQLSRTHARPLAIEVMSAEIYAKPA